MKVNFSTKKIVVWLFALYLFWGLKPYFTWATFENGIFANLLGVDYSSIFLLLVLGILLVTRKKIKIDRFSKNYSMFTMLCGVLLIGICGLNFTNLLSFEWIAYLAIIVWILMEHKEKVEVYDLFQTIFAITLIPSLFYFVLRLLNIGISYDIIEAVELIKNDHGFSYTHYPFAIQLRHQLVALANVRLCGIYDEAGKLGTLAALFLASEHYKLKGKWKNIIIFSAGILSLSIGFCILTVAFFVLKNVLERKFKNAVYIVTIVVAYIIFVNVPVQNTYIASIQDRIVLTTTGLSGDNRTNDAYDEIYSEVYNDPISCLIGFGSGAMGRKQDQYLVDGASYKSLIYNFGYIGFGVSILWLLGYAYHYKRLANDNYIWVIFAIYILNIYQRPSAFFPPFLIIALGGMEKSREATSFKDII